MTHALRTSLILPLLLVGACSGETAKAPDNAATANVTPAGRQGTTDVAPAARTAVKDAMRPAPQPLDAPIDLGFALEDGAAAKHPALVKVETEGPCGATAILKVDRIPAFGAGSTLSAVDVTEVDAKGNTLRQWRLPQDYVVSSLDGDWLLASWAGKRDPIWVNPAGDIGVPNATEKALATGGKDGVELSKSCPASMAEDGQCLAVRDRPAGRTRILVAPGVCS